MESGVAKVDSRGWGGGGEDELIQPDGEVFEREGVDGSRRSITRVVHVRLIRWLDIGNR